MCVFCFLLVLFASLATLMVWLFDSYATICVMLVRYLCDHVFDHTMLNVWLLSYIHEFVYSFRFALDCICTMN